MTVDVFLQLPMTVSKHASVAVHTVFLLFVCSAQLGFVATEKDEKRRKEGKFFQTKISFFVCFSQSVPLLVVNDILFGRRLSPIFFVESFNVTGIIAVAATVV